MNVKMTGTTDEKIAWIVDQLQRSVRVNSAIIEQEREAAKGRPPRTDALKRAAAANGAYIEALTLLEMAFPQITLE